MSRMIYAGLGGLAAALIAPSAMAVVSLANGSATYSFTQPTSATGTTGSATMVVGDGVTANHMFQDQWWWRVNGVSTREFTFVSGIEAGSGTPNGTVTYNNVGGLGFNAVLSLSLSDTGNQSALVTSSMVLTNTTGAALSISLFSYLDFDMGGDFGDDSAIWQNQANNVMRITDAGSTHYGEYQGIGANAFQVSTFATLLNALGDTGLTNLNNSGLPFGPGDFTAGFQWNLQVAAGASVTVTTIRSINTPVPAPGAIALLGLAGLAGARRRRN